jgi:hypothetical protein
MSASDPKQSFSISPLLFLQEVKTKLLVLSGAADPASPGAQGRYKLVADEAQRRGYEATHIVAWPGQDSAGEGVMDLTSASSQLMKLFVELEIQESFYDVAAFSWGASVYLKTLGEMEAPKYLRNSVLWGIDEFWRFSEHFLTKGSTKAITEALRESGTNLASDFYAHQVPNEVLLRQYPHSNPIRIGFGENDVESPPAFAAYLESFVKKPNITYKIVPEVGHIVTDSSQEYLDCLFGD